MEQTFAALAHVDYKASRRAIEPSLTVNRIVVAPWTPG
jgi:hypothetical protein